MVIYARRFFVGREVSPKTIKDTVLTPELKTLFQTFVDNKNVPNLLLTGSQGIVKLLLLKLC